ncbi:MAG: hypothetical protein LQ352_001137 [Teloschistes flavicans]|nr:MAG: hypothetical protein LQ352_001137 [Teloschistes flavicans]
MESNRPSAPRGSREPARNYIQTNNLTVRDGTQRFSWQDTPLDLRRPIVQQSSPTNSSIDETPLDGHQTLPSIAPVPPQSHYPAEKLPLTHTDSPYNVPGISQTHPAYFAPVVEQDKPLQSNLTQPAPIPITAPEKAREKDKSPLPAFASSATSGHHDSSQSTKPESDRSTLVYNPHSLAGPNAAVENHRPGQVAHPNAAIDPEWKHGLCEVDTLCCVGLCCPCIVYGKTQYRISRKTQKEDPTNLLGYQSCNGSCGLMALACGFQSLLNTTKPILSEISSPPQAYTLAEYCGRQLNQSLRNDLWSNE